MTVALQKDIRPRGCTQSINGVAITVNSKMALIFRSL